MQYWSHRMSPNGIIAFEGGSGERDNVDWMLKYNRPSIRKEIENNKIINDQFKYYTFQEFPSMTLFFKKGVFG
jgi:hypothetical protein